MRTPQGKVCCSVCGGTAITHNTIVGHAFIPSEPESAEERQSNLDYVARYGFGADYLYGRESK